MTFKNLSAFLWTAFLFFWDVDFQARRDTLCCEGIPRFLAVCQGETLGNRCRVVLPLGGSMVDPLVVQTRPRSLQGTPSHVGRWSTHPWWVADPALTKLPRLSGKPCGLEVAWRILSSCACFQVAQSATG